MSAEKVVYTLLKADSGVIQIIADEARIYDGEIPQGKPLPAIAYNYISGSERNTAAMNESHSLVTDRIQVSVMAKDYLKQKALIRAVRKACKNKSGVIAGVKVFSVLSERPGPDMRNDAMQLYMQTIDFIVTYSEPNT